jgi:hypothetical protein
MAADGLGQLNISQWLQLYMEAKLAIDNTILEQDKLSAQG